MCARYSITSCMRSMCTHVESQFRRLAHSLSPRSANVWWFVFMCTQLYLSVKEKMPCYGQSPSSSALILALNCVLFVSSFFLGHTQTYYTEIRRCGVCCAMLCAYVSVKYQQISKGTTFRHSKQTKSVCIEPITWKDVCEAQLRKRATITLLNFKRIKRFVIERRKQQVFFSSRKKKKTNQQKGKQKNIEKRPNIWWEKIIFAVWIWTILIMCFYQWISVKWTLRFCFHF